jgi:hypothetical protein
MKTLFISIQFTIVQLLFSTLYMSAQNNIFTNNGRTYVVNQAINTPHAATEDAQGSNYILLHQFYTGTLMPESFVFGEISAIRGSQGGWNRKLNIDVNSASAYNSTRGSIISYNEPVSLVSLNYNGNYYLAVEIANSSSVYSISFTGYLENALLMLVFDQEVTDIKPYTPTDLVYINGKPFGNGWGLNGSNLNYLSGNVGIGTDMPTNKLQIESTHDNTRFLIHSIGGVTSDKQADLMFWASEPGTTYSGVGIANNVTNGWSNNKSFNLVNSSRGGSYIRLLDNSLLFNVVSQTGIDQQAMNISTLGYVGIGTSTPVGILDVQRTSGLIVSGANLDPANGYSLSPLANSRKLLLGWNYSRGKGETDFISNRGEGDKGGFDFYDYSNTNSAKLLMSIEGNGNVITSGDIKSATITTTGVITTPKIYGYGSNTGSIYFASPTTSFGGNVTINSGNLGSMGTGGNIKLDPGYGGKLNVGYDNQFSIDFSGTYSITTSIPFTSSSSITAQGAKFAGNVLIGKTTQTATRYRLDVAGPIRADEVVVNTTGADFVFSPDYKLRSLEEVEKHIKENGFLPEIPSAKEMQQNGMGVSEMQTKLLQKVEELTLYMIELKKENENLQKQVNELRK